MVNVVETIPEALREDAALALAHFNAGETQDFKVTGIIDPEDVEGDAQVKTLKLILCGGDRCEQHTFVVDRTAGTPTTEQIDSPAVPAGAVAELDPPPGPRANWVDQTLGNHAFTVILFYRGFW